LDHFLNFLLDVHFLKDNLKKSQSYTKDNEKKKEKKRKKKKKRINNKNYGWRYSSVQYRRIKRYT